MNFIKEWSGVVAVVIIVISFLWGIFHQASSPALGSTSCGSITCLSGGLRLVTDAGGDFESDVAAVFASTATFTGAATFNGAVTITSTNTATSTLKVGCIQTTATSTATPIKLSFTLAPNSTSTYSGTSAGFVAYNFGTCP